MGATEAMNDEFNQLRAPYDSKVLGPDGKPFKLFAPVEFDRDCPRGALFFVKKNKPGDEGPPLQVVGVVTDVAWPKK
ncbi:MAG TPA: hypothetical protein VHP62_01980 [Usitatibacter sp.]|nr:hypothetical protein [Usitatibacter sp.]